MNNINFINKIEFGGILTKVIFENKQIIKFYIENTTGKRTKKAKVCCFDSDYFNIIKAHLGEQVIISGEFYENNYKDKNDNWVNDYTINMKTIKCFDELKEQN